MEQSTSNCCQAGEKVKHALPGLKNDGFRYFRPIFLTPTSFPGRVFALLFVFVADGPAAAAESAAGQEAASLSPS